MTSQLEEIRQKAIQAVRDSADTAALEQVRVTYLGKKGDLTLVLKQMGKLTAEERPVIGQLANAIRQELEDAISERSEHLREEAMNRRLLAEAVAEHRALRQELRLGG